MALNLGFVALKVAAGLAGGSLALLSDGACVACPLALGALPGAG